MVDFGQGKSLGTITLNDNTIEMNVTKYCRILMKLGFIWARNIMVLFQFYLLKLLFCIKW